MSITIRAINADRFNEQYISLIQFFASNTSSFNDSVGSNSDLSRPYLSNKLNASIDVSFEVREWNIFTLFRGMMPNLPGTVTCQSCMRHHHSFLSEEIWGQFDMLGIAYSPRESIIKCTPGTAAPDQIPLIAT